MNHNNNALNIDIDIDINHHDHRKLNQYLAQLRLPPSARQFLDELLTLRQLSPLTQRRYGHALQYFHAIHFEICAVNAVLLQQSLTQLHNQGLTARSLAVMLSAWRTYCEWAQHNDLLKINPCLFLKAPKPATPVPKALPVESIPNLLVPTLPKNLTRNHNLALPNTALIVRDQAVLELLYGCGLRTAELLSVDCQKTPDNHSGLSLATEEVYVLGKGNKPRIVPLPNLVRQALVAWLLVRDSFQPRATKALFLGKQGRRLSGTELRRITQRRAIEQELGQRIHPHLLRHSYATHLLQSSGDLRGIQDLLGHASIVSTQAYTQADTLQLKASYANAHPRATHPHKKTDTV